MFLSFSRYIFKPIFILFPFPFPYVHFIDIYAVNLRSFLCFISRLNTDCLLTCRTLLASTLLGTCYVVLTTSVHIEFLYISICVKSSSRHKCAHKWPIALYLFLYLLAPRCSIFFIS